MNLSVTRIFPPSSGYTSLPDLTAVRCALGTFPRLWRQLVAAILLLVPILAASAASTDRLAIELIPSVAGSAEPQLAIHWSGNVGGRLRVLALAEDGAERLLVDGLAIQPGMQIHALAIADTDVLLRSELRDGRGQLLARSEHAARSELPFARFIDQTMPRAVAAPRTSQGVISDWKPTFVSNNGPDGTVLAVQAWDDGSGEALYFGGEFVTAGGVQVNGIARWNGVSWSALGGGMNGRVHALAVHQGMLYAGGSFTLVDGMPMPGIARWDGSEWSAVGPGISGTVYSLAPFQGELIAAGSFPTISGMPVGNIARWNGIAWSSVGSTSKATWGRTSAW